MFGVKNAVTKLFIPVIFMFLKPIFHSICPDTNNMQFKNTKKNFSMLIPPM